MLPLENLVTTAFLLIAVLLNLGLIILQQMLLKGF